MASSAGTVCRRLKFPLRLALLLFLLVTPALSVEDVVSQEESVVSALAGSKSECRDRLKGIDEFRFLLAHDPFRAWASSPKGPRWEGHLKTWSTDLLLRLVLTLEQELLTVCQATAKTDKLITYLKDEYLRRLGAQKFARAIDRDFAFRGLVVLKDDAAALTKKLATVPASLGILDFLKRLYGSAFRVRGALVVGASEAERAELERRLQELCPSSCAFWNDKVIYKVLVVPEEGIAAYVPEIAVLVISSGLLQGPNLLHEIVLLHELVHVAEKDAWIRKREDWVATFRHFSGWREENGKWIAGFREGGVREDKLSLLSRGSAFSILPDPVLLGVEAQDGFVLAKSFRESQAHGPSEDLADHAAIYRLFPERFCYSGKNLAPRKMDWVARTVFGESPKTACAAR